jgi:hypothetical protein
MFVDRRTVINSYYLLSVTIFRIPQRAKTVPPRSYEAHVRHNDLANTMTSLVL